LSKPIGYTIDCFGLVAFECKPRRNGEDPIRLTVSVSRGLCQNQLDYTLQTVYCVIISDKWHIFLYAYR